MIDLVKLTINSTEYTGWSEIRITRNLKDASGSFEIGVSERWAGPQGQEKPWQIQPFDSATVSIGDDLVLTGYVEHYNPSYDANSHSVRVAGRSKTCDLIDCMPAIAGGDYRTYKLDAIAKAVAAPFGINVVVEADVGDPLPDAVLEKTETAFAYLERLARLRSVLLTDNEKGDLVLTTAGKAGNSSSSLIGGGTGSNILSASAKLASDKRFQTYVVLGQTPLAWNGKQVQTDINPSVTDPACPRYRRFVELAEDPADTAEARARATWRMKHNRAEGSEAQFTVQGFRQADGSLWKTNQLISVSDPVLEIQQQMLIGGVTFMLDESGGSRTELSCAPPDAFSPEPDPKMKNNNSAVYWKGVPYR